MKDLIDIASGTVTGKDHRRDGKNNHDGCHYEFGSDYLIAVVTDGCGSGKHSEVGAKVGACMIVHAAAQLINYFGQDNTYWERVRQVVLAQLRMLARQMGRSLTETVNNFLLFASVGVVMNRYHAVFFSLGDGYIVVNGTIFQLGPFPGNAPPYLSYGMVKSSLENNAPEQLRFTLNLPIPTGEIDSFLIGTDGLGNLINATGECIPGKDEPIGPISQFWEEDRYFTNPDNVRRRLTLINREYIRPDWEAGVLQRICGHLPDDTTLIVGRKRRSEPQ